MKQEEFRMEKRHVMKLLLTLLLMVSVVLCGCSDKKAEKEEGKSLVDGEVSSGGSITVGITQDMDGLDPHKAVAAGTKEVLYNIFEGLVKPDKDGNLIPAVASEYSVLEEGRVYSFTLRDGVKFHDGTLVTAGDIIYSLKRCAGMLETKDPLVQVVPALSVISEIRETEKGVDLLLSEPNTELIAYLTCSIIPEDYKEQDKKPIGTGPFRFVSYAPLQSLVVEKNPDYYVANVPSLDKVTFKISANTDAAFMELLAGSIDIFPYLTAEQAAQLSQNYQIETGDMNLVQALFLNNAEKPFDNPLVRQAMCYAVDRQAILEIVGGGKGTIIGSNVFSGFTKYFDPSLELVYPYDPEKAKSLLAEAGYKDGFTFTITVPSNYQFHVDTAQVIVSQLEKVGIKAEIKLIEWASWLSDVYAGRNYQSTIVGLDAQLAPSDIMRFYPSDADRNFLNYDNSEFDLLYKQAKATTNEEEKVQLYKKLQGIVTEDAASVFIQSPALLVAVNKKLAGYTFYPVYVQDMSTVYFK